MEELRRFAPFAGLGADSLSWLAGRVKFLDVPAGRWLVRRGRTPPGEHFLWSGSLRTYDPDRVLETGHELARLPVLQGAREIQTLTLCRLLQVPTGALSQLAVDALPAPVSTVADDGWQVRFLRTHIMTRLSPALWQTLLRSLESRDCAAGEVIISQGDAENVWHCYIVAAGRAAVSTHGHVLKRLGVGELFGEDALISCQPRNATVQMTEPGRVMLLHRQVLLDFLVRAYREGEFEERALRRLGPRRLNFDASFSGDLRERIAMLDPCASYRVVGDQAPLALFLIRGRGIAAFAGS